MRILGVVDKVLQLMGDEAEIREGTGRPHPQVDVNHRSLIGDRDEGTGQAVDGGEIAANTRQLQVQDDDTAAAMDGAGPGFAEGGGDRCVHPRFELLGGPGHLLISDGGAVLDIEPSLRADRTQRRRDLESMRRGRLHYPEVTPVA